MSGVRSLGPFAAAAVLVAAAPVRAQDAGESSEASQPPAEPPSPKTLTHTEDLVRREIDLTLRLLRTTPHGDAVREDILFRLAQLYFEMADGLRYRADELERTADELTASGNAKGAAKLRRQAASLRSEADAWTERAERAVVDSGPPEPLPAPDLPLPRG